MSSASPSSSQNGLPLHDERREPWAAALISVLLHLLLLLLLLHSNPPVVSIPDGASGGGRVKVDFVGEAPPSPETRPVPPQQKPSTTPRTQAPKRPAVQRRADNRKPVAEARYIEPASEPEQEQAQQTPPDVQAAPAPAAAAPPASSTQRRPQTWTGRPPGMLDKPANPDDMGRSAGQGNNSGNRIDRSGGEPAMEVGGFQIVYDLLSEEKLRTRMDQGMKELWIPLPGTRHVMVCPAEVALRRGSSKCRMLPPDSPELTATGDARDYVIVMFVYRYGELLWRGPGPYR